MLLDPAIPLAQGTGALPPIVTKDSCGNCIHDWHGLKCRYCGCSTSFDENRVDEATGLEHAQARALIGAVLCTDPDHHKRLPCQFCGAAL